MFFHLHPRMACLAGHVAPTAGFPRSRMGKLVWLAVGMCVGLLSQGEAQVVWANLSSGANALDSAGNWSGGILPTASDVASFTSASFYASTLQLQSGNLSVAGVSLGAGAGALTFSSNSSNGQAKTLSVGSSGVVNSSSNTLTFDVTSKVNISLSANASFVANSAIVINDAANSSSGFDIGAFTLTLDGTSTASSLAKGFTGTGTLVKAGSGTWTLTGASPFTGATKLSGGILSVSTLANGGTASNIGKSTNAATNLVFDGGTLQYTGAAVSTDRLFTLTSSGGVLDASGTGALTFSSTGSATFSGTDTSPTFTLAGTSTAANTLDVVLGNSSTGLTSLTKSGAGTWVLAGSNTLSGIVTVSAGTLTVNSGASLSSSAAKLIINGGTLNLNNTAQTVASFSGTGGTLNLGAGNTFTVAMTTPNLSTLFAGNVSGSGTFAVSGVGGDVINLGSVASTVSTSVIGTGATLNIGSGAGPVALGSGSVLSFGSSATQTGVISGAGSVLNSSGTTTLSGANTYSGGTSITGGKLVANNAAALGTGSVSLTGGTLGLGTGITLTNPITLNGGTLNATGGTFGGTISFGSSGGTLAGTGNFTSSVTIGSNVTLSPGNSPGTLTFTSGLTLGAGGSYTVQVQDPGGAAGTGYDTTNVTGILAFTSTSSSPFTFSLQSLGSNGSAGAITGFNSSQSYNWTIATATSITGFSSTLPSIFALDTTGFTNALNGGTFTLGLNGTSNALILNFSPAAVPEPSTWALMITGLGAFAFTAIRRRAKRS